MRQSSRLCALLASAGLLLATSCALLSRPIVTGTTAGSGYTFTTPSSGSSGGTTSGAGATGASSGGSTSTGMGSTSGPRGGGGIYGGGYP